MREEQEQKLMIEEFSQAWKHYQHVADVRTRYMNFFFTSVFAVLAFIAAIIKPKSFLELNAQSALTILILFYIYSGFILFVYSTVVKLGYVLFAYDKIITKLRAYMYATVPKFISVHDYLPKSKGIFSVQYQARVILLISMFLVNILSTCLLVHSWYHGHLFYFLFLVQGGIIALEIVILNKESEYKKKVNSNL